MLAIINIGILALSLILAHSITLLVYRLIFHPLAHFPGPKVAAATKWYEAWFDIGSAPGGQFFREIERMHRTYGPIVRINPDEIHIQDPDWYDVLYAGPSGGIRDKYPPAAHMVGTPLGIFGTVNHSVHRARRATVNPLFSKKTVHMAEKVIYDHADKLVDMLAGRIAEAGSVELRVSTLAFSTDIVCRHAIGTSLDLLSDWTRAAEWRRNIAALAFLTPYVKQFPWLIPLALQVPAAVLTRILPQLGRIVGMHRFMHSEAASAIDRFRKNESATPSFASGGVSGPDVDLFRLILYSGMPEVEKHRDRIAQEGLVLLGAGGETSSRMLTYSLFHVLNNQKDVLQPLRREIMPLFADKTFRPSLKVLEQLPFLTAVLKETLRLTSLFTSRAPLVDPHKPLPYQEWLIPPNTAVSMSLRDILHDPSIFEAPLEFRPERWLPSNPNLDRLNKHFVPFSRGNRMCLGMNLAMAELYIALPVVLTRLDLELFDTTRSRDIDFEFDYFVGEPSGASPGVRVTTRGRANP